MNDESWDLTPAEHFARARELAEALPEAGDHIGPHFKRMFFAQRHATMGMVDLGLKILEGQDEE